MTTLPKNEFSKSISSIPEPYFDKCKSTTYAESKKSRITKSFIKTNYATVVSSGSKGDEKDNRYFIDSKKTFCNNLQTRITEFKDEDEVSKGDAVNAIKMISMSLYITKHPLLTKEEMPLLLKQSFEINDNDHLSKAIIIFFRLLNKSLKDKDYKFSIPKITQIKDTVFKVKPMKKNGKPDCDLPAFDLETSIRNFGFNSFSLIFNENFIVSSIQTQKEENKEDVTQVLNNRNSISKDSEKNITLDSLEKKEKKNKIVAPISLKEKESHCCNSCLVF